METFADKFHQLSLKVKNWKALYSEVFLVSFYHSDHVCCSVCGVAETNNYLWQEPLCTWHGG